MFNEQQYSQIETLVENNEGVLTHRGFIEVGVKKQLEENLIKVKSNRICRIKKQLINSLISLKSAREL